MSSRQLSPDAMVAMTALLALQDLDDGNIEQARHSLELTCKQLFGAPDLPPPDGTSGKPDYYAMRALIEKRLGRESEE